jgi:hypothetical protein
MQIVDYKPKSALVGLGFFSFKAFLFNPVMKI